MPQPRGNWGLDPVVECLLDIGRDPRGLQALRDEDFLSEQQALLDYEPVAVRRTRGLSLLEAVEGVIADVRVLGAQAGAARTDVEAVAILLGARSRSPRGLSRNERLRRACTELNKALPPGERLDAATLNRGKRRDKKRQGPLQSPESDLYERFVQAADHVSLHAASSTQTLARTRASGTHTCRHLTGLVGTWRGTTESGWLLKDPDEDGDGIAECFMTIRLDAGELAVQWFYRSGGSTAVAARLVHLAEGHRLVCCYEADLVPATGAAVPSHRGACLLDIGERGIEGSYFTDRRTHGVLRFTAHDPRVATDFRSADWLFKHRREDGVAPAL